MRDSWKEIKLVDLASFRRGSFPQPYGLDKWYDDNNGMPFIQVFDVDDNMKLKRETKRKISKLGSQMSVFIPKGTLILTIQGSIGRVAITDYDAYMDRTLLVFQKFYEEVDLKFIMYIIRELFKEAKENANGSTIKTITKEELSEYTINLPPLPQQRKIANILSTCDDVIEKTEAAIAKYQALKQGMMHDLFTRGIDLKTGKLRPKPEQAPDLYEDSELGKIPKDWRVDVFENLCPKVADRDHFTPTYFDTGVPIISPKDFDENHNISFEKCKFISNEAHLKNCKKTDLRTDDLVFTRIGAGLGKVAIVESWMPEFSILHSSCMIRTFERALNSKYLMYFIKGELLQKQISIEVQSIGVPDLGLDKIRLFKCLHPVNLKEQELISKRLSTIDDKIFIEQSTKAKFEKIKSGLMQDLLTGKVEVKVELEKTA